MSPSRTLRDTTARWAPDSVVVEPRAASRVNAGTGSSRDHPARLRLPINPAPSMESIGDRKVLEPGCHCPKLPGRVAGMMRDVFVSYANEDRARAELVVAALESANRSCWIAPRDIVPGSMWPDAIAAAIAEARCSLFVITAASDQSRHIAREAERADRAGHPLIPVLVDEVDPGRSLGYYFGASQQVDAYQGPLQDHLGKIVESVNRALAAGDTSSEPIGDLSDDDLVALARSICWDIRPELMGAVGPEEKRIIDEPKPGQRTTFIDLAAVRAARETIEAWSAKTGVAVALTGEDISPERAASEPVTCVLDALDGTQHWIRGRNLWATALSLFRQQEGKNRLRVSAVQLADGSLYIAREDTKSAHLEGSEQAVAVDTSHVEVGAAHVCTVSRRPGQFKVLAPLLGEGSPFNGLYTFGGNPILVELALGRYDAVFQPDASSIGDAQELWDWLPGGHIAMRSGCTIVDLDGSSIDVVAAAAAVFAGTKTSYPFVAAGDPALAAEVATWLRAKSR